MISGALLLNPSKAIGWKNIWRYERRMILVLATFGYLFCLAEEYVGIRAVSFELFGASLLHLLSGQSWEHLWYIYAIMGIYLLLPVFKSYVRSTDRAGLRWLLIVLFIFTLVVPTVNQVLGTKLETFVWLPCYVLYFLLGYYAYRWLNLDSRLVGAALVVVLVGCVLILLLPATTSSLWVSAPASPFVAALALLVFLAFRRWFERPYKKDGFVALCSSYSLGIYVLHPVFLNIAYKVFHIGPWSLPPVVFELGVWAYAFFGSILAMWVLRKVPGVRKIL